MKQYDEAIFEAALEITASAAEEAEMTMDAAGGKAAAEFFRAVYDGIAAEDENAEGGVFEVYEDKAGEFRFRLKARNGEVIAASEGYTTKAACLKGIAAVKRYVTLAEIKEVE